MTRDSQAKFAQSEKCKEQIYGRTDAPRRKRLLRDDVKCFSFGVEDKMRTSDADDAHCSNEDGDGIGEIEATTI